MQTHQYHYSTNFVQWLIKKFGEVKSSVLLPSNECLRLRLLFYKSFLRAMVNNATYKNVKDAINLNFSLTVGLKITIMFLDGVLKWYICGM